MRKTITIISLMILLILISSSFVSAGFFDWLTQPTAGKAYESSTGENVPVCPVGSAINCAEGQRIVSKNFGYDANNCPISAAACCGNGACESPVEDSSNCAEDCASTEIKDGVKCVFENSDNTEKCYSDDQRFSCSGIGTCVMEVSGKQGSQIIWKSSCGGYAYTTIDGQNEYATFKCVSTAPACTDSDNGDNIYVKGLTADSLGSSHEDKCVNTNGGECSGSDCNSVAEGICNEQGFGIIFKHCPSSLCKDGACVKATPPTTCFDSDGEDYYNYGYISESATNWANTLDTCRDDNTVEERVCVNGRGENKYFTCPNGCSGGVCSSNEVQCKVDSDCPQTACACIAEGPCACPPQPQPKCVEGKCVYSTCSQVCKYEGTKSEGWYDSCTGDLLKYDLCGAQPGCATTNVCDNGYVPKCFMDNGNCICEACPAQPVCKPEICKDGTETKCVYQDGNCACSTCPSQPTCESTKCEDGSFTKCAMNMQTGQCLCSACPPVSKTCDNGCSSNGKCIPFGTRIEQDGKGMFCDIMSQKFLQQKAENEACQNNYECITNSCSSGICIDIAKKLAEQQNLLQKILDWLSKLF